MYAITWRKRDQVSPNYTICGDEGMFELFWILKKVEEVDHIKMVDCRTGEVEELYYRQYDEFSGNKKILEPIY